MNINGSNSNSNETHHHADNGYMNMNLLSGILLAFFVIVVGVIILRIKGGEKFEVKTADLLVALIPIGIFLVMTNKVKVIEFGGFKIESAFVNAAEAKIAPQVTAITSKLPVDPLRMDAKGGLSEIPRMIEARTDALTFQLGVKGYYGPAIETYLQQLSAQPFFKYVVVNQPDGKLVGVADGRQLATVLKAHSAFANDFVHWLETSDDKALKNLPGYVSANDDVEQDADRLSVLERMETLDTEALPVVGRDGKLTGMVQRSRLLSSLISDVLRKVK